MLKRGLRTALALLLTAPAVGCISTVVDESFPALGERRAPIQRVAVARMVTRPEAAIPAAPLIARELAEALVARGVEVVMPDAAGDAGTALGAAGLRELADRLHRELGVDAVLVGEITRWVEREGGAAGSQRPASVGMHVELYGAPDAQRLWRGQFDHTQQALTENLLLTPQYPGGGTRWLTATEFAQFGARELAAALPLTP